MKLILFILTYLITINAVFAQFIEKEIKTIKDSINLELKDKLTRKLPVQSALLRMIEILDNPHRLFPENSYDSVVFIIYKTEDLELAEWDEKLDIPIKKTRLLSDKEISHLLKTVNNPLNYLWDECKTVLIESKIKFYQKGEEIAHVTFACSGSQLFFGRGNNPMARWGVLNDNGRRELGKILVGHIPFDLIYQTQCADKSKVGEGGSRDAISMRGCPMAYYKNEDKVPINVRDSVRNHIVKRAGIGFYESLKLERVMIVDWQLNKEREKRKKEERVEAKKQGGKLMNMHNRDRKWKCNNKIKYHYRYKIFFNDSSWYNIPIALGKNGGLISILDFPKKEADIDFSNIISLCDAYDIARKKDASKLFPIRSVWLLYEEDINRWVWVFINATRTITDRRGNETSYWRHRATIDANSSEIYFDKVRIRARFSHGF